MDQRYFLSSLGIVNALGSGVDEVSKRLFAGDVSGMVLDDGLLLNGMARVGRASSILATVPNHLQKYNTRNNQLLLTALEQVSQQVDEAINCYGASRIGVVLGSSTSGMAEAEVAFAEKQAKGSLPHQYHYEQQEIGCPAVFLAKHLKINGPTYTVSTACTSSAKAFQSARNLLRHNICDAVLVGGVDSLCRTTVNGFSSLESVATDLMNPMSQNRKGINIGEGAALFLLSREGAGIELLGIGESSDAYHISAPQPEGVGAERAMRYALEDAKLKAADIQYLNLHATATPMNDKMESLAVARVFPRSVPASGTKPLSGHTLGAAGATELAFCFLALKCNQLPPHVWDGQYDQTLPELSLVRYKQSFINDGRRICMSNSFAFGGSNISLIIGENI